MTSRARAAEHEQRKAKNSDWLGSNPPVRAPPACEGGAADGHQRHHYGLSGPLTTHTHRQTGLKKRSLTVGAPREGRPSLCRVAPAVCSRLLWSDEHEEEEEEEEGAGTPALLLREPLRRDVSLASGGPASPALLGETQGPGGAGVQPSAAYQLNEKPRGPGLQSRRILFDSVRGPAGGRHF